MNLFYTILISNLIEHLINLESNLIYRIFNVLQEIIKTHQHYLASQALKSDIFYKKCVLIQITYVKMKDFVLHLKDGERLRNLKAYIILCFPAFEQTFFQKAEDIVSLYLNSLINSIKAICPHLINFKSIPLNRDKQN